MTFFAGEEISDESAEKRDRKQRLTEEIRRLIADAALLDAEALDVASIDALTTAVGLLADRISGQPTLRRFGGLTSAPGFASALRERSPVSGRANPVAPPLHFETDGELTHGTAVFGAPYEGPPGSVHGGVVAAAFDELLGVAQAASGIAGYTGTLTIKLRRLTPLHVPITYEAGVTKREGRKIFVWGRSFAHGEVTAEAEGLFIAAAEN